MPLLVDYIFGSHAGEVWHATLSTPQFTEDQVALYPNPAQGYVMVSGVSEGTVEIYSMSGAKLYAGTFTSETHIPLDLSAGIYMMKVSSANGSIVKKLVVK